MSTTSLTPEEIRAAAETHRELGPEYQSAVIESFLDKVGKEIDARVDARVATARPAYEAGQPARQSRFGGKGGPFTLATISMVLGIPLTGIEAASHGGIAGLAIVWGGLTAINIAFNKMAKSSDDK